ncbi:hypothetical protein Nocox_24345 [Nonomuraea coxensis DSM 45129]|uniref:Uncharacterized protein n=1 Tax=Nonomuraea coxensis DSM 45129 TaxID=1122611 RepID=A0ABX8U400_9ACTN|nr:hypothetical protein [Nonomuraea coxensis]QYC42472.1 hypothetical protein Nocox_24345 [Nonomuraea coxensis DSM 45129]
MNETGKVALALVAGYYLGRRHKLRMATAMAATVLFRRLKRNGGDLLSASPELGALTGRLRGELLDLTKSAAMTAAVRQIEALADRLEQAGQQEQTGQADEGAEEGPEEGPEEGAEEGTEEGTEEGAEEGGEGEEESGGEKSAAERSGEEEDEEKPRSTRSRLSKPRVPKPHVPRAADRVRSAAAGVTRRRSSDRDKTRE